jgi:hypothetical protein
MKQQLNEVVRMQHLAGVINEVQVKTTKATDLQFILRDLGDAYGEGLADDQITDDFKNYTIGQIKNDWIKLKGTNKESIQEETINVVDSIPELQKKLKDLAVQFPKIKGIDVAEVKNITALLDAITSKLGKGSTGNAIKAATDIFNSRTASLK